MNKKELSIICPVYNEEECVPLFIENVKKLEKQLEEKYKINIFFSNNASTDGTYDILNESSKKYDNIYFFTLSKNFGYQNSLQFTLSKIDGDIFLIIDVDGEDPVNLIPNFLKFYEEGFDIVYGERIDRKENFILKNARKLFYRFLKILSDDEINLDMSEFALFTREVKTAIMDEKNSFPFLRSSISRVGYKSKGIKYSREKRIGGKSNFNLLNMIKFAVAGVITSTTLPLRIPLYFFPFWFLYWVYVFISSLLDTKISKYEIFYNVSIFVIVFCLTFVSAYLARLYKNLLQRSNAYLIKKKSKIKLD